MLLLMNQGRMWTGSCSCTCQYDGHGVIMAWIAIEPYAAWPCCVVTGHAA